ncbi:MalY/PatB family protein [Pseudalkalibacillus decolorationis]|uniref:MalY/PatB family protein n=1 Tax=Pseudalkalibacillus decolorationis TaxID=163879 RepID=UPI0021496D00|nr:MalY/PatB family protein [Pseudalkalibacillus decolorationis]
MKYDFDQVTNRLNTDSVKWDKAEKLFREKDILPMWIADMDLVCPQPVIDAIKKRTEHGMFGYTTRSKSYFDAFIGWLDRRHNWAIKKQWIRCTPGIMPAISFIIQSFTQPGDKVIIQTPVYHPFTDVVVKNERELVYNPLKLENGRYVMDYEDLERKIDADVKMIILCNPHNPVGRVWTKEELNKLGEICIKHNVLIVSDEAHLDFIYKDTIHTPFARISDEFSEHSITCTAPSKTFNIAGLQMANIIIPNDELRKTFTETIDNLYLGLSNTFGIVAAENAYRSGDDWLDQCLDYLKGNLDYLTQFIETNMKQIKVIQPEGTYLVWLDCRELGMDARQLEQFLQKEAKVAFDEGYKFGPGGEGFTRINIACPRSVLEEGLKRIERVVNNGFVKI